VRTIGVLLAVLVASSGQAAPSVRHLVYQFGFNTSAAASGRGTGTITVDILGPAADGGVEIRGTDSWWNTVRPRATNTCELYANGGVSCTQAPFALSPIQLTLFPLLARNYFAGLSRSGTSSWKRTFNVKAALVPGAAGFAGQLTTWACTYTLQGKGPIPDAAPAIMVHTEGTLVQQGGRYFRATSKQAIAYDPVAGIPVAVRDVRTHLPQTTVFNNDLISLKLSSESK
jgi:hypothetical protein